MAEANTVAAPDWRESLPADIKAAPALKDIKDIGTLAKGYLESQATLGRSLRLPSKEAGEEDRKAFRAKVLELGKDYGVAALPGEDEDASSFYTLLGRPGKPEEYEVPEVKHDGIEFDGSDTEIFRSIAHDAGLSKKQFKSVVTRMAEAKVNKAIAEKAARDAAEVELKKEWGDAFEPRRREVGARLKMHGAPAALVGAWEKGLVDPESARWLHALMDAFGDEPMELQRQGKRTGGDAIGRDEALARVAELEARLSRMQPGDPDYQALVTRRVQLIEKANLE